MAGSGTAVKAGAVTVPVPEKLNRFVMTFAWAIPDAVPVAPLKTPVPPGLEQYLSFPVDTSNPRLARRLFDALSCFCGAEVCNQVVVSIEEFSGISTRKIITPSTEGDVSFDP